VDAKAFYETEAIRGGWSVRQLDREVSSEFYLTMPGEADPVGLILCSDKDDAVVRYAMGGIQAQVFASKYLAKLPPEEAVRQELLATKHSLESRAAARPDVPAEAGKAVPTKIAGETRKKSD
jgi:hypothetical protein